MTKFNLTLPESIIVNTINNCNNVRPIDVPGFETDSLISGNFSYAELVKSDTAIRHNIDNNPDMLEYIAMWHLCANILQPLRDHFGVPVYINSGYRCRTLNSLIGGSKNSQHIAGCAADIRIDGWKIGDAFKLIASDKLVPYDQIALEHQTWIHISYSWKTPPRGDIIRYERSSITNKIVRYFGDEALQGIV